MSMMPVTKRWARGTGQWNRSRVIIVATDTTERDRLVRSFADEHDVVVAMSPLDVIRRVETDPRITMVVISDVAGSVCRTVLTEFLEDNYPLLRVVTMERSHHGHDEARAFQYA